MLSRADTIEAEEETALIQKETEESQQPEFNTEKHVAGREDVEIQDSISLESEPMRPSPSLKRKTSSDMDDSSNSSLDGSLGEPSKKLQLDTNSHHMECETVDELDDENDEDEEVSTGILFWFILFIYFF